MIILIACFLFLGNIWFWKDEDGVRHYSNVAPPMGTSVEEMKENRHVYKKITSGQNRGHRFRVVKVFDGDTVKVTGLDLTFTIRLAGIDSPEIGYEGRPSQPFSQSARQFLRDLVENKKVAVKSHGTGGYNRQLAELFIEDTNINLEMIAAGLAEVYTGRLPKALNADLYRRTEAGAKQRGKGMWTLGASYKSPRQWRKEYPRK